MIGSHSLAGEFNPTSRHLDLSTVTGTNVGYLYHGGGSDSVSIRQNFEGVTYTAGNVYEFMIDIGDGKYDGSGDQPYVLNIYAGSTLIGTRSGSTGDIDTLETVTVTSDVFDASLNGETIGFEIVNPSSRDGGEFLFDNVRATVTPG